MTNRFLEILCDATQRIAPVYMQLPTANRLEAIYRERVYTYELYHQMRDALAADAELRQYMFSGELDKSGHAIIRVPTRNNKKGWRSCIPDFVLHSPGDMASNIAVVEVKPAAARKRASPRTLRRWRILSARALMHPPPSPKRCYVDSPEGRVFFDADRDEGAARGVPADAHRRFRADERLRRERNMQERARRLALHDEKTRFIAEWIAANGKPDQRQRHAAGLLPIAEAIEAVADEAFAALREWPLYERNGPVLMQAHVRRYQGCEHALITGRELAVADSDAVQASAAQWTRAQEARAILPDATVTLRTHRLTWRGHPDAPALTLYGLLVVRHVGPLVLRREFAVLQS